MSKGPSKVVRDSGATGERRVQNGDTIQLWNLNIVIWEGGKSKQSGEITGEAIIGR